MKRTEPARTGSRTTLGRGVALVVVAVIVGTLVYQSAWSSAPPSGGVVRSAPGGASSRADGAVTAADGVLPDGVTVFDGGYPGVAKLDAGLLRALRKAATDAAHDGVRFFVHSAWRSADYQNQLLREAIATYGSKKEAARWVASAQASAHVSGDAIDLATAARTWLSKHGARYGLCRVYRNEPWHYELRPRAIEHGCPPRYADPTQDPRMKQ